MSFFKTNPKYTDREIVEAHSSGNRRVELHWYERCRDQFRIGTSRYGGLSTYDREDLFLESYELLWEKFDSGQIYVGSDGRVMTRSRDGERPIAELTGHFMAIVRNKYLERLRERRTNMTVNEEVLTDNDELTDMLYRDEDPESEKARIVSHCLMSLPKSCIEILTMFYFERMTLEEILAARPENTSYDGLKSRKSKCMTNIKKRITESFERAGLK